MQRNIVSWNITYCCGIYRPEIIYLWRKHSTLRRPQIICLSVLSAEPFHFLKNCFRCRQFSQNFLRFTRREIKKKHFHIPSLSFSYTFLSSRLYTAIRLTLIPSSLYENNQLFAWPCSLRIHSKIQLLKTKNCCSYDRLFDHNGVEFIKTLPWQEIGQAARNRVWLLKIWVVSPILFPAPYRRKYENSTPLADYRLYDPLEAKQ